MRKNVMFFVVIGFFVLVPFFVHSQDRQFVSSKYSIKYHRPTCKLVRKIHPQIRVTYTAKEALASGRIPCNVCKPPKKD